MKNVVRTAALAAVSVVAVACSGGESDGIAEPQPSAPAESSAVPTSTAASGQELPHSGAPAVTNPLPKSALGDDVCAEALTPAQAKELLGDAVKTENADQPRLGPGCTWSNQSTLTSFVLNYDVNGGQGLSDAYANAKPKVDNFTEAEPVGGFPLVQYTENDDKRTCTSMVGLADDTSLVLSLAIGSAGLEKGQEPCEASRLVLERVVGNLKAKA